MSKILPMCGEAHVLPQCYFKLNVSVTRDMSLGKPNRRTHPSHEHRVTMGSHSNIHCTLEASRLISYYPTEAVMSEDLGTEHQAGTHPTRDVPADRGRAHQGAAGAGARVSGSWAGLLTLTPLLRA